MSEKNFFRNCPICNCELGYTQKREMIKAEKNKSVCRECGSKNRKNEKKFFRNCPICNKELGYTSKKNRNKIEKEKRVCSECAALERENREEIKAIKKENGEKYKTKFLGEGNPFYGRHHTEETKRKIIENTDYSFTQTEEFKLKSKKVGKENGMYGKTFYEIWVEKYGKEEADKKLLDYKEKKSIAYSGKNNPMYGKTTPIGSGNGWGGWYKDWYFRSLRELSYMIEVIEKKNQKWETGEKKIIIYYKDYDGTERTYKPDFIIDNKIIVEIKPKKLMETPTNILKKEAAIKYCKEHNLKFKMIDVKLLSIEKILELYLQKKIIFNKTTEIKFNEKYKKLIEENKNGIK